MRGGRAVSPLQEPWFFWPILAEFFIPPGNMFIRTVFLRNNSVFFLKKCKNELKNGVLSKKVHLFYPFFAKMDLTLFFCRFCPNFLFLPEICLFQLSFYETLNFFFFKCKNRLKNGVLAKKVPLFYPFFAKMCLTLFFLGRFWLIFLFLP